MTPYNISADDATGIMVEEYQVKDWDFFYHVENKTGERQLMVEMTLSRQFFSIFMVTYLPTILMNIINQVSSIT